jgi:hypothetical protein
LRGDVYQLAGQWQRLAIPQADTSFARQVPVLRATYGPNVDPREAFVDLIVLNAYAGSGVTNVWIDDLEVLGSVPTALLASRPHNGLPRDDTGPSAGPDDRTGSPPAGTAVQLRGSVTEAHGRPFFPRIIEYNGETFDWLKSIGFNTVKLPGPPTGLQLREAERLGLWLVAPPPPDHFISPGHDRVLAWNLGSRLTGDRLEPTRAWTGELRRAEIRPDRLLVGEVAERTSGFSRLLDLLIVRQLPLGSPLTLRDFGLWLEARPVLAKPGTPWWAEIQTEPSVELMDQWMALGLGLPTNLSVEPDQIRLQAFQAIASGARGLIFTSRTSLDQSSSEAEVRAKALRRLSLELDLIEPWVAGGSRAQDVAASSPDIRIGMLQTERSQLLIILDQSSQQQFTVGPVSTEHLSLVVPCVATAPRLYLLTPGGLQPLPLRRVPGGIRIQLEQRSQVSLAVLTQDPLVIGHAARTLVEHREEASKLHYELAQRELDLVTAVQSQLVGQVATPAPTHQWLSQALENLRHCEVLLGGSDYPGAHLFAEKSLHLVAQVRQHHWQRIVQEFAAPVASPYCVSFPALGLHAEMARRLQASPEWSPNVLPAGDFESLEHVRNSGWQNIANDATGIRTTVELAPRTAHSGSASLRLQVTSVTPDQAPQALERPPIEIISPALPIRKGQIIRIHGWVNVPEEIRSSHEGLQIYDSLAGLALADRIRSTDGWREFVLYRAAPSDGVVSVTFALSGVGEAYLDDVVVTLHESIADRYPEGEQGQARRFPPVGEWQR